MFYELIKSEKLTKVKEYYHENKNCIHSQNIYYVFKMSCINGNLEVAKWLYGMNNFLINIHANNDYIFRKSCLGNHINVAKWLLTLDHLDNFDICYNYNDTFRQACINNNLETVKFIFSLYKYGLPLIAFREAFFGVLCISGNIEIIKWLIRNYSVSYFDIHYDDNIVFNELCLRGKIDIIKFLLTLDTIESFGIHDIHDYIFDQVCKRKNYDTARFLISIYERESYISGSLFMMIKKYDLVDNKIYLFVNDDYLNIVEKKIKNIMKEHIRVIEKFMFKCYYGKNGINMRKILYIIDNL